MEQKQYKRKTREMADSTKQKISAALRGRKKTPTHCQAISDGLKAETGGYWSKIAPKQTSNDNSSIGGEGD